MQRIILVEDDDSLRDVLKSVLEAEGFTVSDFESAEKALPSLQANDAACILSDFRLPGKDGIALLKATREITKDTPFIIMTAYGSIDIAVEAMKLGANDFITKPFEPENFCSLVRDVLEHKRIINRGSGSRTRREREFLTKNPQTERILTQAQKVARVDTSVLILGESGTGKELVARYIHENSARHDKPFIAINCAAMPAELLESEFFGHEAGAFTGATQTRKGVFEIASEGTIFLDEIGDMPLSLQVKLLRALQQGEIKRVGGNKIIKINPRVLAATNCDVEEAIKEKRLREDFYYRLAVVVLTIPPLRLRKQDIEVLTTYYVNYFSEVTGREKLKIDQNAKELLAKYPWPGNARELENVIERAVVMADDIITAEHLGLNENINSSFDLDAGLSLQETAARAAKRAEVELITETLNRTSGNKSKAAELLGVSYKTLLNKVKEYQIQVQ